MVLKPQDVVVTLKLLALGKRTLSYAALAQELFMSPSEVHAAIKRAAVAGLIDAQTLSPVKKAVEEFLLHGIRYAFPPERGGATRGMATGYAAPPLNKKISQGTELPPVWPSPDGTVKGYEFAPLYRSVSLAAAIDSKLYELLTLVDAIRGGRARERSAAIVELKRRLNGDSEPQ